MPRASLDVWNRENVLPSSGIEILGHPARSLVTILTELLLVLSKIVRKLKGGGGGEGTLY